jgi:ABC-2 type transport system permease protein
LTAPESARAAGAIYDLGYQHYKGQRLGRSNAIWTLFAYSFRTAYGLGRGERAKLVPFAILAFCFMPAIVRVGASMALGQPALMNFAEHLEFSAFFLALFAASQASELIVTDRQYGTLPLYLSRPLHATDYMLAKFAALTAAMLLLTLGPQIFMYIGKLFIAENLFVALRDDWRTLLPIIGGTVGASMLFASLGLALGSFASRRDHANALVIGFFLLSSAVVSIFHQVTTGELKRHVVLAHPVWVMNGFVDWLFDLEARNRSPVGRADLPGEYYLYVILAACATAMLILFLRYRNRDA